MTSGKEGELTRILSYLFTRLGDFVNILGEPHQHFLGFRHLTRVEQKLSHTCIMYKIVSAYGKLLCWWEVNTKFVSFIKSLSDKDVEEKEELETIDYDDKVKI